MKALIVHSTQRRPPYVHNLRDLLSRLADFAPPLSIVEDAIALNPHYRATRYPGVADDPDFYVEQNVERLLERMEQILGWVREQLP